MELREIQIKIREIRGLKVILDFDVAELYGTETKRVKEAVRRNINRFPPDFMFELTKEEFDALRTHFASSKKGGIRYTPFAFTEQGVAMLSSVLSSEKAIEVNISIVRAFVFIRQYALSHNDLTLKLKELESKYAQQFTDVFDAINYLLKKDELDNAQKDRKRIGFINDEFN
ncbi:MAG TPA: ORF6N domain-containing protein [Bacteroidia bacterium]